MVANHWMNGMIHDN